MISIQTNLSSLNIQNNLDTNNTNMQKAMARLSSGFRINSAADDAAGYAIATKMSGQEAGMEAASNNALQATAMVNMADSAVNQIQNMVTRVQALATEAASANNSSDISKLEAERAKLETEIDKIANSTNYNGVNLLNGIDSQSASVAATVGTLSGAITSNGVTLTGTPTISGTSSETFTVSMAATATNAGTLTISDGTNSVTVSATVSSSTSVTLDGDTIGVSFGTTIGTASGSASYTAATAAGKSAYTSSLAFQVGSSNSTNDQVSVDLTNKYTTAGLGLSGGTTAVFTDQASAQAYITTAKAALDTLTTQRADLGATSNQLGYVNANLQTGMESVASAISTIKDANMAQEMANYTKSSILVQAGTAMLSKSDQNAMNVLSLFK